MIFSYHKFTRGKDVSKYSKKDLSGILGHAGVEESKDANSAIQAENSAEITASDDDENDVENFCNEIPLLGRPRVGECKNANSAIRAENSAESAASDDDENDVENFRHEITEVDECKNANSAIRAENSPESAASDDDENDVENVCNEMTEVEEYKNADSAIRVKNSAEIAANDDDENDVENFCNKTPLLGRTRVKKRKNTNSAIQAEKSAEITANDDVKNKVKNFFNQISFSDIERSILSESDDVANIIKNFERRKEELLNRYRENYKKKLLPPRTEKNSGIHCDLDGRKLDCKPVSVPYKENPSPKWDTFKLGLNNLNRKLSKAERIIFKTRLLKLAGSGEAVHDFKGSNLSGINGYGNKPQKS